MIGKALLLALVVAVALAADEKAAKPETDKEKELKVSARGEWLDRMRSTRGSSVRALCHVQRLVLGFLSF